MRRRRGTSSVLARFGIAVLVCAAAGTTVLYAVTALGLLVCWLISVSVVSLAAYGYDKAIAGSGLTRVPEKVLLGLALAGGTVGAALGMVLFRHKTRKRSFWGRLLVIAAAQAILAVLLHVTL